MAGKKKEDVVTTPDNESDEAMDRELDASAEYDPPKLSQAEADSQEGDEGPEPSEGESSDQAPTSPPKSPPEPVKEVTEGQVSSLASTPEDLEGPRDSERSFTILRGQVGVFAAARPGRAPKVVSFDELQIPESSIQRLTRLGVIAEVNPR